MPTYQYQCKNCGHEFEIIQSMKEDKLSKCPNCSEETLHRLIGSGSGLIFKGSGFYLTDYVKKGEGDTKKPKSATPESKPAAAKDPVPSKSESAGSSGISSAGSDSKPA